MSRAVMTTITNMCMIYDGDKVVIQDRVNKKWGGITFPGGHVEKDESFTDAVIREVYEETGLHIKHPRLCGIKDWPDEDGSRYIVLFYKTNQFSGELRASDEGEVRWCRLEDLPTMKLANDMEDMLRVFLEDDLSEFFYYFEDGTWKYDLK